jgi:glucose/mannose transport system substrate-binding protein
VVGAATDAITAFFNSDQTPDEAATALADAIAAAR